VFTRIFSFIALGALFITALAPRAGAQEHGADSQNISLDALVRGYYLNDQRISWSGLEETFGAEAAIDFRAHKTLDGWSVKAEGEFFLNQPYDKNKLLDEGRVIYHPNFDIEPFEISRLNLKLIKNNVTFILGKSESPFGRSRFPVFTNSKFDAPFIRTEAILWRETGVFLNWRPAFFVIDLAVVNGSEDMDTNSSKGGIARLGVEGKGWAFGVSAKKQDGIGSENQKYYKNHYGFDFMLRRAAIILSVEAIYDEYGFRYEINDADVYWPRSLYDRDLFYKNKSPIYGKGGYVDLTYHGEKLTAGINYGEYHPKELGITVYDGREINHDEPTRRWILKTAYSFTPGLQAYGVGLMENNRRTVSDMRSDVVGLVILAGLQYRFGL
jgi:hypothetical protein